MRDAIRELFKKEWKGAQGLAEDVRFYGRWMRDEAEKRIGHLYPESRSHGQRWRRTAGPEAFRGAERDRHRLALGTHREEPNPAFAQVDVPLASTFMLSTKAGRKPTSSR